VATGTRNEREAAGDMLATSLHDALEWADAIRPRVHPDNPDDEIACALAALCLQVRAITLATLSHADEGYARAAATGVAAMVRGR
jgi:hypothetical protein